MDSTAPGLQVVVDDDDDDMEIPAAPPRGEFHELPVYGVPPPDRVYLLEATLAELERGIFRRASLLGDSMLRDDRVAGTLQTRINSLLGCPEGWNPSDEDETSAQVCDELKEEWPEIAGPSELGELLRWALLLGVGLGEIIWDVHQSETAGETRVRPRLKVWHPQFLYWRWDTRSYWLITQEGNTEIIPGTGKWVLLTPYGYNRSWLRGLIRSLSRPWMIRNWTYRDAARRSEIYGQGIRQLIAPAKADERTKKRLETQLANAGNETTITTPQGEEGNRWDIKIVEATAQGFEAFFRLIKECDDSIAVNVLGQTLTTDVRGGSRAAAQVHDNVRGDLMRFDAQALSRCVREHILEPYCKFNFGDPELAPLLEWNVDPPTDGKARSDELFAVAQALAQLAPLKIPLDLRALLEEHGIPITPGSPDQLQLEAPEPAPMPGEKPDDDNPKDEDDAA